MIGIKVVIFSLVLFLLGAIRGEDVDLVENTPEVQVLRANCEFSRNLYKVLAKSPSKNVVFSPISVHAVLSMVLQGSGGTTTEALAKVLRVPDAKTTALGYKDVLSRLNATTNATLLLADKIFIKTGYQLQENFQKVVTEEFLSQVESVDFEQETAAAKIMNDWVSEKTQNKIQNLIDPEGLTKLTRLILINAIYFKGDWLNPFDPQDTHKSTFHLDASDSVQTDFMSQTNSLLYKNDEDLNSQVIELPYVNPDLCLFVILPKDKDGIAELERKFVEEVSIENITSNLEATRVSLLFPKFKIEQTTDLKESLKTLGLEVLFDEDDADLSKTITTPVPMVVDKVIQKAFIEINERGSEAAAATFVEEVETRLLDTSPVIEFKADHPFLYILMDRKVAKNPLFVGRFANPSSS